MKFDWDEAKAKSNLEKHGVSFGLAERVFDDIWRIERADEDEEWHGEERWVTTGLVGGTELVVVHGSWRQTEVDLCEEGRAAWARGVLA